MPRLAAKRLRPFGRRLSKNWIARAARQSLEAQAPAQSDGPESSAAAYAIRFEPAAEVFSLGLDPLLVLRDLAQLGRLTSEADLSRLPALASLDPERCYLGWRLRLENDRGDGTNPRCFRLRGGRGHRRD